MLCIFMIGRSAPRLAAPARFCRHLLADHSGASAVMVALAITGLIGFTGLGTEAANWYVTQRSMQGAADAAAYGAALAGSGSSIYTAEAKSIAASYGFVDQQGGVTVAVNNPPLSGNYASNSAAIEVIVSQPQPRLLSRLYLTADPTIASRAVALRGAGPDCVLALDPTASGAISAGGTTNVDLIKCGIADDSNNGSAMSLTGGGSITANSAAIVGGLSESNGGTLTTVSAPPQTGANVVPDPYQYVQIPAYSGCTYNNLPPVHGAVAINANGGVDVFCNGVTINGGGTLTLQDGIFIIDRGSLSVAGGATLNLVNASIVLTSSSGSNWGTVTINGGATVNATAPTSGAMAGIAFFQDRNAPSGTDNFNGGSSQAITGALYFPSQTVDYTGGVATGSGCTQVIADQVSFSGNSAMESNCAGTGVRTIASLPKQVE
jgi:Flp pilus assembly protein TadG